MILRPLKNIETHVRADDSAEIIFANTFAPNEYVFAAAYYLDRFTWRHPERQIFTELLVGCEEAQDEAKDGEGDVVTLRYFIFPIDNPNLRLATTTVSKQFSMLRGQHSVVFQMKVHNVLCMDGYVGQYYPSILLASVGNIIGNEVSNQVRKAITEGAYITEVHAIASVPAWQNKKRTSRMYSAMESQLGHFLQSDENDCSSYSRHGYSSVPIRWPIIEFH